MKPTPIKTYEEACFDGYTEGIKIQDCAFKKELGT